MTDKKEGDALPYGNASPEVFQDDILMVCKRQR